MTGGRTMKITIPTIYIQDCEAITVAQRPDSGSIKITYDDLLTIVVTAPGDDMPKLEIVEESETGE
jgi:hypothetical protein